MNAYSTFSSGGSCGSGADAEAPTRRATAWQLVRCATAALRAARERRRAIDTLQALDDRTLRDIGIERSAIRSVVMERQAAAAADAREQTRPVEWSVNLQRCGCQA